jgi:hypothetical protein
MHALMRSISSFGYGTATSGTDSIRRKGVKVENRNVDREKVEKIEGGQIKMSKN